MIFLSVRTGALASSSADWEVTSTVLQLYKELPHLLFDVFWIIVETNVEFELNWTIDTRPEVSEGIVSLWNFEEERKDVYKCETFHLSILMIFTV